jgi:hypothetical protein
MSRVSPRVFLAGIGILEALFDIQKSFVIDDT